MYTVIGEFRAELTKLVRRVSVLERQEKHPASSLTPVYSGTPTANALAYWTGAGTVAGDRSVYVTSSGSVGIQTASPTHLLQVGTAATDLHTSTDDITLNNTAGATMSAATAQGTASPKRSGFVLVRSRGDFTTPTAVGADDSLGFIGFKGYDGSNAQLPALIEGFVDGSVSSGTVPARFSFITGANGSTRKVRLTIFNDGKIQVGDLTSVGASLLGVKAGTSSNDAAVGGVLYVTTAQVGNVGIGEDVLASYSIPANTLAVNGQSIWFEASGTHANSSNTVDVRARFGTTGTSLIVDRTDTASGRSWTIRGRVIRTGSATQKGYAHVIVGGATSSTTGVVTNLNQTLSGAVTIEITGEGTSNNDVVLETFIVGWGDSNT